MSEFNLSALLIELESGGCKDLTVQELEFVLEYINKGLRNKVGDCEQDPVATLQVGSGCTRTTLYAKDVAKLDAGLYNLYTRPVPKYNKLTDDKPSNAGALDMAVWLARQQRNNRRV